MTQSPRTLPQGDDGAPVDVTYVSSVAQGVRARQERGMHDAAPRPAVRRRAMPQGGVGDYGARPQPDAPWPGAKENRRPPELGETQVESVAYPDAAQQESYGIPDDPFSPPAVAAQPQARRLSGARTAYPSAEPEGPRFAPPASPEIPDWLAAARHNNMPLPNRQAPAPRVSAAPRQTELYEDAGYPRELMEAYRQEQQAQAVASAPHRRHGAQYAVDPYRQPRPEPQPSAPPQQQAAEELPLQPRPVINIPWLGIAAFAAALAAVALWILGMSFDSQLLSLQAQRAAEYNAIVSAHPLRYEELLTQKAAAYNLDPAFVAAIIMNESSFQPDAESSVGARGLMQLMDETAAWIHDRMGLSEPYSFDSMYDPETNVEFGCWYLNFLAGRFRGDPILVAAGFHAGQGEVQNWLNDSRYSSDNLTIRLEDMMEGPTKRYATRVLDDFAVYKSLYESL